MNEKLAEKLAHELHKYTWSEDMCGYIRTEEELKNEILEIANE